MAASVNLAYDFPQYHALSTQVRNYENHFSCSVLHCNCFVYVCILHIGQVSVLPKRARYLL